MPGNFEHEWIMQHLELVIEGISLGIFLALKVDNCYVSVRFDNTRHLVDGLLYVVEMMRG